MYISAPSKIYYRPAFHQNSFQRITSIPYFSTPRLYIMNIHRLTKRYLPILSASIGSTLISLHSTSRALEKDFHTNISNSSIMTKNSVVIALNRESRDSIEKKLESLGYSDYKVDSVAILSRKAPNNVIYELEPLFCDKIAFRMKGIVKPVDKDIIAIYGRVSQYVGELKDDDYEPCIVATKGHFIMNDYNKYYDLATRVNPKLIPNGTINGNNDGNTDEICLDLQPVWVRDYEHDTEKVIIKPITWNEQIVLEGRLCSLEHLDENGKCLFDRSQIKITSDQESDSTKTVIISSSSSSSSSNQIEYLEDENEKCPLCRYMKKGSCRSEFIEWDKCVSKLKEGDSITICNQTTLAIFLCMVQDEYYDIMTTNSHNFMSKLVSAVNSPKSKP